MNAVSLVTLGILILLLGAQWIRRPLLVTHRKKIFAATAIALGFLLLYQTQVLFLTWVSSGPPLRFLVPPYASLSYFLFYSFSTIWFSYCASFVIALAILGSVRLLPPARREAHFEKEEIWLLATAIFLLGEPLWIAYLVSAFVGYFLYNAISLAISGHNQRRSFYYFWLPTAIAISLLGPWLLRLPIFWALSLHPGN